MYRSERKQPQKRIKFIKSSYNQDNVHKYKGDYIPLENTSPSSVAIPVSTQPCIKRTKTKHKISANAATYYHTKSNAKSQHTAKLDKTHKFSSRVTHVLSSRVKEYYQLSDIVESCCSSSISMSSNDSNEILEDIDTLNISVKNKRIAHKDSVCCISESVKNLPQARRIKVNTTFQNTKCADVCACSERKIAKTSVQKQMCDEICTCSENVISSTQLYPTPPTKNTVQKKNKSKIITIKDQENTSEISSSSCSDLSTTSATAFQHLKPTSKRNTKFGKYNSFEKVRLSKVPLTKKVYKPSNTGGTLESDIRDSRFYYSRKHSNFELQYQRSKSRPAQSIITEYLPYKELRSRDRPSLLPRLSPSDCSCSEDFSSRKSDEVTDESSLLSCPKLYCSCRTHDNLRKSNIWEDFYDPHMHRMPENPTNYFETLVHLVKCVLGTGILAMPQSFAKAGLIPGTIFTVITGVMITHCLRIVILAQYVVCQRKQVPLLNYSESMEACLEIGPPSFRRFSKFSGILVNVFLIILQLGICCIYIVFIASSLKKIVDPHYCISIEYHMLIILGPLIAANCIPNLKVLTPFSALGNLLIIVSLAIIIYYLLTAEKKTTEPLDLWGSIYTFPLFFGTILFALTAVAVVTTLENNMKTPKDFVRPLGVLNIGMLIIILIYVLIGTIGYIFCRSKCSDSIIYDLPENSPMVIAVFIMYAVGMLISYVLQCFVPIEILRRTLLKKKLANATKNKRKIWDYFLRMFLCLLTFMVALAIPHLGLIASLVGALCLICLAMIFPTVMEMVNSKDNYGRFKVILIKDILLFVVGFCSFIGVSTTAIIHKIKLR